jgi:hypothetical protein
MNETGRDLGYFIDSRQERGFIGSRRFVETADFSDELERGSSNLFSGDGRIKVEKRFDIPAHFRGTSLVTEIMCC